MQSRWVIALLAVSFAAALVPHRAEACSCSPDAFSGMIPENGSTNVARNHAIIVSGYFVLDTLELTAADGTSVAFELVTGPISSCEGTVYAELIVEGGFAANTEYRVRAAPKHSGSAMNELTFTTGDWFHAPREDFPTLEAELSMATSYPPPGIGCVTGSVMSCISLNTYKGVEVIARKQGGEMLLRHILSANDPNFLFKEVPECIELNYREPTGTRTKLLELCGEALNAHPYDEREEGTRHFFCEDGLVGIGVHAGTRPPPTGDEDAGQDPEPPDAGAADSSAGEPSPASSRSTLPATDLSTNDAGVAQPDTATCSVGPPARGSFRIAALLLLLPGLGLMRRRRRSPHRP